MRDSTGTKLLFVVSLNVLGFGCGYIASAKSETTKGAIIIRCELMTPNGWRGPDPLPELYKITGGRIYNWDADQYVWLDEYCGGAPGYACSVTPGEFFWRRSLLMGTAPNQWWDREFWTINRATGEYQHDIQAYPHDDRVKVAVPHTSGTCARANDPSLKKPLTKF